MLTIGSMVDLVENYGSFKALLSSVVENFWWHHVFNVMPNIA